MLEIVLRLSVFFLFITHIKRQHKNIIFGSLIGFSSVVLIVRIFEMGGTSPCASCKLLRRRCSKDCIFAPYFPSDDPRKFSIVHKVFGASNISKMLQVYVSNFHTLLSHFLFGYHCIVRPLASW